jgi:colicin import membrane protein
VDQAQLELQLKVWKELAISKQMLMRTATDALKLDPNCSQDELKDALEKVIKGIDQSKLDIAAASTKQETGSRTRADDLAAIQERMTKQMAEERASLAKEMQKLKDKAAEKERALKAVNTALADTPENVIKKMNGLKKQKQDEADARQRIETSFAKLRTEKTEQDKKLADTARNTTKLITTYKDLHAAATKIHEQLKPLVADANELSPLPTLDEKLIEEIENPDAAKDKKNGEKDERKKK